MHISFPHQINLDIGHSVSALQASFDMPPKYWTVGSPSLRFKVQHELTDQLDAVEFLRCSTMSHDPAVNAQFIGSCLPHMCLPFNAPSIPRSDLDTCNEFTFPHAVAFHSMMPLFPQELCLCGEQVDPLGLHFGSCLKVNARNLLHNAVRDCLCGAARHIVKDLPTHNVAFIKSDSIAKSSTYIHPWYPRKSSAPPIRERPRSSAASVRTAPSKSPDVLISFLDEPHRPIFGDFVFSSPSPRDNTRHSEAAQRAHNAKLADYSKHHDYPSNVFFPLAAERSGYLHPAFHDFITVITTRATSAPPRPSHKLQLLYSVAHSITYMTAALLRSASFQFTPIHVKSLMPPPPLAAPVRWAPVTHLHNRYTTRSSGALSLSNGSQRRHAEISLLSGHAAPCVSSEQPNLDPSEGAAMPCDFPLEAAQTPH